MRSIAEIARDEGEDYRAAGSARSPASKCSRSAAEPGEAAIEGGYFAVRAALARSVSESARFLLGAASPARRRRSSRG